MLGALIIVFREVIEAGLIVGIAMAVTHGVRGRETYIASGILAGVLGACLVAAFIEQLSGAFEGAGQEMLNASILLDAVVMLTWHNVWMARHGRELAAEMAKAGEAVRTGASTLAGLAVVVAVAVLREGSEVALFLYGILIASEPGSGFGLFVGGMLGLVLGGALSVLTYRGLLRIPGHHIFRVTSILIALLAAGLTAQAIAFLQQAGFMESLRAELWDSSAILSEGSLLGRTLHTLVGYSDRPSLAEALGYAATIVVMVALMRLSSASSPRRQAAG